MNDASPTGRHGPERTQFLLGFFHTCNTSPLTKSYDPVTIGVDHLLVVDETNLLKRQKLSSVVLQGNLNEPDAKIKDQSIKKSERLNPSLLMPTSTPKFALGHLLLIF